MEIVDRRLSGLGVFILFFPCSISFGRNIGIDRPNDFDLCDLRASN